MPWEVVHRPRQLLAVEQTKKVSIPDLAHNVIQLEIRCLRNAEAVAKCGVERRDARGMGLRRKTTQSRVRSHDEVYGTALPLSPPKERNGALLSLPLPIVCACPYLAFASYLDKREGTEPSVAVSASLLAPWRSDWLLPSYLRWEDR